MSSAESQFGPCRESERVIRSLGVALGLVSGVTIATALAWTDPTGPEVATPAASAVALPEIDLPPELPAVLLATPGPSSEPRRLEGLAALPELGPVRDAVAAYRKGDLPAGDKIRSDVKDPVMGALLDWVAIRYAGTFVSFERVQDFTSANPDWPGAASLRRRAEERLVAERKPAATVKAFFARERPQTAAGKLALALALKADGVDGDALALVRDAWRTDVFGRELEAKVLDAFGPVLTQADHRARMERLLFKESWEGAKRAADLAGKGYDALVKARIAVDARAGNAGKLLDAVPPALRTDTSYLFSRAQFLRRSDKADEAARAMASAPRDPALLADPDEWWVERRLVARKLLDASDYEQAYAVVERHAAASNEKRLEAEFTAGWIALRFLHDPDRGAVHFARAAGIAATPISSARAAYWEGRAAEARGDQEGARAHFDRASRHGTTYYGQLAAAKLGRETVPLRLAGDPTRQERLSAAKAPAVRAVEILYAAGLRDVASPLVAELARAASAAELEVVGDLALAQKDAKTLLALGKLATQRGLPLDEAAFPVIGVPAFEPVGSRVERAIVYAIARQESAFDPAAGSPVGARGLMQLMPATAQAVAKRVGVAFDAGRLVDASYNARLGAAHLGDLLDDWRGSFILTFASYNAGPGNVKKWIQAYGDPRRPDVDPVDWVERIPFYETRNYVQRVMENLQVYRKRLDARSALVIDSDLRRGGLTP
ncbi:MAG: lytic transglycosylase domain-containing protein [Methylobacteriaceae bacterium]|nr:lytic transglycosylase domain-containing protein [Methylobacteriaceae bacterium]